MNVSGRWTGEYRYDPPSSGSGATFTLHLKQSWLGRVTGTVEDGPGGMPEPGRIVGWVRGRQLRFRKLMPLLRITNQGQTVPLAEYLASSGDLRIAADTPHPPVRYTGIIQADGNSASGVWSVSGSIVRLAEQEKVLQFPEYSGSWVARRGEGA